MQITPAFQLKESAFQELRKDEKRRGPIETWFAIRTAPGSQRSPSIVGADEQRGRASIVERSLRNEGFEVFMPTYRIEVRHHRNKRWIEKRFATFVGYAFVNLPTLDFRRVEEVEGVSKLLKFSKSYAEPAQPFAFPQETIDRLRYIEWEQDQQFLFSRAQRIRQEELEAEKKARKGKRAESRKVRNARFNELGSTLSRTLTSASSRLFVQNTMHQLMVLGDGLEKA